MVSHAVSSGCGGSRSSLVQSVVRLIFAQFTRRGSVNGLLRWLVHHDVKLPIRPHYGANRGELEWRRPNRVTLLNVLHHPIYAGAYSRGRRPTDPRRKVPGRPATGLRIRGIGTPVDGGTVDPRRHAET